MLPEVAERENGDGGSDVNGEVPTMTRENETVSSSETTTLFCGLDGVSSVVLNVYPRWLFRTMKIVVPFFPSNWS
uniref:Ig-like domain-containing protein n=1 Tax=Angiostrongylus cantonensis TaxID=6313 RepID=A0A0K0D803_ANGCA